MKQGKQVEMVQEELEQWMRRTFQEYDITYAAMIGLFHCAIMWCYDGACGMHDSEDLDSGGG